MKLEHTKTITPEQARARFELAFPPAERRRMEDENGCTWLSAVGHEATAQVASEILGYCVPVSRIAASMRGGDEAICIKLRARAPEGVILTTGQMEAIGYDLVLMSACDQSAVTEDCFARTEHDPDSHTWTPTLEVTAANLVGEYDRVRAALHRAELAGGWSQDGVPLDSVRAALVSLCRATIEEAIAGHVEDLGGAQPTEQDERRVRASTVSRLIDVLQERGTG